MKCAMCSRPLLRATVQIGAQAIGRVCAQRAGLLPPRTGPRVRVVHHKAAASPAVQVERDDRTGDLFGGVDEASQRCRIPADEPELRVIAGAAHALIDLGRRPQDIEIHRPSLQAGTLAVERLWPRLSPYALGIAALDFDRAMAAAGLLRHFKATPTPRN